MILFNEDCIYLVCKNLNSDDILKLYKSINFYMPTFITKLCLQKKEKEMIDRHDFQKVCDYCTNVKLYMKNKKFNRIKVKTECGLIYGIDIKKDIGSNYDWIKIDTEKKKLLYDEIDQTGEKKRYSFQDTIYTNGNINVLYERDGDLNEKCEITLTIHIWNNPNHVYNFIDREL